MKRIGKGQYSTVYRTSKGVLIKSHDPCKEALALWPPKGHVFPKLRKTDEHEYEGVYYPKLPLSLLKPSHKRLYEELKRSPVNKVMMYYTWSLKK